MATLLLKEDDITKNTPIGGNVETSRLIPAIKSAQITAIKPLMGEAFYAELVEKFKTDDLSIEYETLYEDYIKPMLIHLSTAYYFSYGAYNIGNKGIYKATGADSEGVSKNEVDYLVKAQEKQYESYKRGYFAFMEANSKLFPLYSAEETRLTKRQNYGGWTFGNTGKGGGTAKAIGITNAQYLAILERLDLLDIEVDERVFTVTGNIVDNTDPVNPIITAAGVMFRSVYDTDNNGVVDNSERLSGRILNIQANANTVVLRTSAGGIAATAFGVPGGSGNSVLRANGTNSPISKAEIDALEVDAGTLDGLNSSDYAGALATTNALNDRVKSVTTAEPNGSDKVVNIVSLTQAEYDAGTPVSDTFYIIK